MPLSHQLCAEIKRLLQDDQEDSFWSRRGRSRIIELRQELALATSEGTSIVQDERHWVWWTFAGLAVNQTVANMLSISLGELPRADNLFIRLPDCPLHEIEQAIADAAQEQQVDVSAWTEQAGELLKFSELLPPELLTKTITTRLVDMPGAQTLLNLPITVY